MQKLWWVIPGKLAGRAGPAAEPWDLPAMRAGGVTAICSATEECEPENIKASGLKHIQKYMPSSYPTNPMLVSRFASMVEDAVAAVVEEINAGGCVVVHCYAGRDRSGLILCGTLMVLEKISAKEALARVRAVRPGALGGPGVVDVLDELDARFQA